MSAGLQGVMFSWLVAMVLFETPQKVGLAQTVFLLPGLFLVLLGGGLGDRYGLARVATVAQCCGVLPPLFLAWAVYTQTLSFSTMLLFAVAMGCVQAIVTPARDGLLNEVAGGRVQRTVMLTSLMQFGFQIVGVLLAGMADRVGGAIVLLLQSLIIATGALALSRLQTLDVRHPQQQNLFGGIREGARTVLGSPGMRSICIQNIAMGVLFMGSFMVTMPLLVREVFAGSAGELSAVNALNAFGLSLTIAILLRFGDIQRQGRALLLAQGVGALVLFCGGVAPTLPAFLFVSFAWGVCGGMAMTMSRTIMQELAPPQQRARVMSFYALTFMGAGPIGATLAGLMVGAFGPQMALMVAASVMTLVVLSMAVFGNLWRLQTQAAV